MARIAVVINNVIWFPFWVRIESEIWIYNGIMHTAEVASMVCSFTRYAAHSLEQLERRSVRCVRLSSCGKVRRNTLLGPLRCGEESAGGRSLLVGSRLRLSLTAVVARQVVASALIQARGRGIHWRLETWSVRTAQRVCGVSPVAGVEVGSRPWLTLTFRVRVSQGPFGCMRFPAAVGLVFLMVLVFFICRLRSRGRCRGPSS